MSAQSCSTDERRGSGVLDWGRGAGRGSEGGGGTRHAALRLGVGEDAAIRMLLGPQEPSGRHPLRSTPREGEGQVAGAGGTAWTSATGPCDWLTGGAPIKTRTPHTPNACSASCPEGPPS